MSKILIRKAVVAALLMLFIPVVSSAQSMSDEQVMKTIIREHEAGRSNSQIVVRLMQSGVNIQQIQRVRKRYEQQLRSNGTLGTVPDETAKAASRLRNSNGDERDDAPTGQGPDNTGNYTNYRVMQGADYRHTYDEDDPDYLLMQQELGGLLPVDTAELVKQLQEQLEKRDKKVFGRDIFNNKNLTFEPNMNIATPQNYRLGPGDAVIIDIYGASQKTMTSSVSPDGDVNIEGFGPIQVSGLSIKEANARIQSQLGKRYSSSRVRLTLGQTRTITINIMGEVKAPGTYTVSAFASVFHALYMAGGTNDLGTLRNIKIYRNSQLISMVDIYDYILNGKLSGNVRLADNDVIVVGPYDCLVNITGKVKRPMYYEMKKNESLGSLLKYAGGFTGDAYRKSVRLTRKTGREFSVFNVEEFDMNEFLIADGDSVAVDSIIQRYENMVEIKGAVFRPGKYHVGGEINSVRTLIEHAEGLTEEAFTARAIIHRMKEDRTLEVVRADVAGIMKGTVPDVPLKSNDVLFIPTRSDAMIERTITIHGEVYAPGIYKYADNETLEDFVLQAGGLTDKASVVKVDVSRRMRNPHALTTDSIVARTYSFALKDGFVIDGEPGFVLMPYDEVYVRRSPGFSQQKNVTVEGEVIFSGVYTLSIKNQRLSDIIREAGGLNDLAYAKGARLERRYTSEERKMAEATLRKAREEAQNNLQAQIAKTGNANLANLDMSEQLKKYEIGEYYPVGIELDKAMKNPGGSEDIVLREGDRIIVPQYDATVKINGEVMYPNTVGYIKGKSVKYYIDQAGGFNTTARKKHAYIIYMNGTVAKVSHNAKPSPGCQIVVPAKMPSKGSLAETLSIATTVGSLAAVIATIANILK